jgi:hypothetical protein
LELVVKSRQLIYLLLAMAVGFGGGVLAGDGLSSGEARKLIARMGGIELSPDDVHIRQVDTGLGGRDAVVEALVQTAFKLTRRDGRWSVTHVRTGDRQWESVELVTTAVQAEKIKRTKAELREVAQALEAYRLQQNGYPEVRDFAVLIDTLYPQYLGRIIREDYWHRSYIYTLLPTGYQIRSLGPDGKQGTSDDIIIENGELISPAVDR